MVAEVKIQIRSLQEGVIVSQDVEEITHFLTTSIQKALYDSYARSAMFDPRSGEPYHPGYFRPDIATSIAHASVISPIAVLEILQSDFSDDDQIVIEPCILHAQLGDDDD